MSKYTVELRYIIENEKLNPPSEGELSLTNILATYPIFKEVVVDRNGVEHHLRDELNEVITSRFYFREIGFETVQRFLFYLNSKLNQIMPLYNQRYDSVYLDFNPLWNVDLTESYTQSSSSTGKTTGSGSVGNSGNSTNTSSNSSELLNVDSDTPNQQLTDDDIKANLFASKTSHNKDNSSGSISSTSSNNETSSNELDSQNDRSETYTRRNYGSSAGYTFAQNIDQWRKIMINVNMEIVKELEGLFMNIR